ncbi:MAG TPA: TolC family protein [Bacteroidales bacterium]
MKKKEVLTVLLLLLLACGIIQAQTTSSDLKLSLKEAQDYAIQNNKLLINSRMEVEASKMAIWETISNGLPQISASAGYTDNIKLPVFLFPDIFGPDPSKKVPITLGSKYNTSLAVQATMPIFSAPLYIGIETVKLAKKLAETSVKNTELDTREAVASAYYLILVSEESLKILQGNLSNLKETLKSTKSMFSAGMAESTDVDQMVSNVTMVENSSSSLERTIELNYNLLRFQLGVKAETKITLTETLTEIQETVKVEALLAEDFNYTNNISYKLTEGQAQLSALNLKSQKALVLPSLAGVYSKSLSGQGDRFSPQGWTNSSLFGFQMTIPIIGSGQRYSKIRKAQIELNKAGNTKEMVAEQLLLQEKQLRYNLVNANLNYKSQKDNVEVSKRVYTSTENKFKQGMASSLELTQANSLYLQSENNYVSSLMNLLQTKLALDKLLNNMN